MGAPPPETTSTVEHQDWVGDELRGTRACGVAYVGVDLTEATTEGVVFDGCTFRDVRFNVSAHVGSAFVNCTFTSCSFFDATFTGCKLVGSAFRRCSFDLLKVVGGDWSFVGLSGADLRRTSFVDVRMREADLTRARCEGATLTGLDLSGAWLSGAALAGADLRSSDLSALQPEPGAVAGAVITYQQAVAVAGALGFDVRPG